MQDATHGTTTGVSAADRAKTVQVLANPESTSRDLIRPGHVFPLRARKGGVMKRAGHTESAVDLTELAGLPPAGVLCELVSEDGSMSRLPELREFAKKHSLPIISIADLVR
jgi:3,4-dihydroxy-2-butanone 4-phosphate synthase